MRTVAIIQARLGSTRFPHKVLADLNGKPILQHVYECVKSIAGIDEVAIAVPFGEVGSLCYTDYVEGPYCGEADVLTRFSAVAHRRKADVIMRITADCPVLNPVVASKVLTLYHASQPCDFASNDTTISGYPDGWDVEVFSRDALERAAVEATGVADREHVTPWMRRNLRCVTLVAPEPWTGPKKLSVDTIEDLETVKAWLV